MTFKISVHYYENALALEQDTVAQIALQALHEHLKNANIDEIQDISLQTYDDRDPCCDPYLSLTVHFTDCSLLEHADEKFTDASLKTLKENGFDLQYIPPMHPTAFEKSYMLMFEKS